jgi:hypothetical protein
MYGEFILKSNFRSFMQINCRKTLTHHQYVYLRQKSKLSKFVKVFRDFL